MKQGSIFKCSAITFLLSAVTAATITVINRDTALVLSNILAIVFWLTMVSGFILCGILAKKTRPKKKGLPRPLLLFQTTLLKILDTAFLVSVIGEILCIMFHSSIAFLWAVLLFINILTFEFHFLLSINYKEEFLK